MKINIGLPGEGAGNGPETEFAEAIVVKHGRDEPLNPGAAPAAAGPPPARPGNGVPDHRPSSAPNGGQPTTPRPAQSERQQPAIEPAAPIHPTPNHHRPNLPPWWRRSSRSLWIRLAIGVIIIVASLFTNRTFVVWGLFATFAIQIVPIGRLRSFLVSFAPYAAVWFVFSVLRSLANQTVLAKTLNTKSSNLERWLFNGQLPSNILQDHLFNPDHLRWYDFLFTSVHWSFFLVPHLVAFRLWQKHPDVFKRYLRAMTLTLAVSLCIYFLIPSNPPWMAPEAVNSPAGATVYRIMKYVGDQIGGGLYRASYKVVGESNPIAAMPSVHFAITFLVLFGLSAFGKRWRLIGLIYASLMAFSLVYLGEHYVIDIVAGAVITTYSWVAAGTWMARPVTISLKPFNRAAAPVPAGSAQGARS